MSDGVPSVWPLVGLLGLVGVRAVIGVFGMRQRYNGGRPLGQGAPREKFLPNGDPDEWRAMPLVRADEATAALAEAIARGTGDLVATSGAEKVVLNARARGLMGGLLAADADTVERVEHALADGAADGGSLQGESNGALTPEHPSQEWFDANRAAAALYGRGETAVAIRDVKATLTRKGASMLADLLVAAPADLHKAGVILGVEAPKPKRPLTWWLFGVSRSNSGPTSPRPQAPSTAPLGESRGTPLPYED